VAYKDRGLLLGSRPQSNTQSSSDLLNPVLLLDGRAAGLWKRVVGPKSVQITLAAYGRLGRADRSRLVAAAGRYAEFLGRPAEISWAGVDDVRRMRWG
jgi:hypothetical protein